MRSITQHYEGKNIYTRPLQGKPYYRNSGIIYAVDRSGNKYSVARVDLERFDDQNFQYVFTPDWDTIDSLPTSIFQGIHGLDMSMRLERYYTNSRSHRPIVPCEEDRQFRMSGWIQRWT